jgi:hypothetical protein
MLEEEKSRGWESGKKCRESGRKVEGECQAGTTQPIKK